eukprot:scaffold523_cov166-Amphora_coffeaeformis.AAC.10
MSTSTQQNNKDPSRGGEGHQGGRRGRGKKKRNRGGHGGDADTTRWRALEKSYRDWLIRYGFASNAKDFGKNSIGERIQVVEAYKKYLAARLNILYRENLVAQTNPYAAISQSHFLQQDSEEARNMSISFYGLPNEKYCQVLGPQPEHSKVVNAHVWPRSLTKTLSLFGLEMEDIHNRKNVLRLHQSIECAFDRRELAFTAGDNDSFVVKVLCPEIMSEQLKGVQKRFADIHGNKLKILKQGLLPFQQLLVHHSVLAHQYAREKGWIREDLAAEEFNAGALLEHSLDKEAQEWIKLLWKGDK